MMTIGQLARRAGVRPSAIRYYERRGLLGNPARSAREYRLYGAEAETRLRFVRCARELGFSLDEAGQLIDAAATQPPCALTRSLIEHHLVEVEKELRRLNLLRDRLKQLLLRPAVEASDTICPLIEGDRGST